MRKALQVLINLEHRGACGCEANTGDGAGILIQMPDAFLRKVVPFALPASGAYGAGLVFLPRDERDRDAIKDADRAGSSRKKGRRSSAGATCRPTTGWSATAPGDAAGLPAGLHRGAARRDDRRRSRSAFERKLYVIRKRIEHAVDALEINALSRRFFYIVSLSCEHADLQGHADGAAARADVPGSGRPERSSRRSRSCTSGSAPTRSRRGRWRIRTATSRTTARSTRCAATSTGCARARGCSRATCFGDDLKKMLPVIREGGSDTATFDNVLEFLVMAGRSLPHAILMMIPEPWSGNDMHGAPSGRRSTSTTRR